MSSIIEAYFNCLDNEKMNAIIKRFYRGSICRQIRNPVYGGEVQVDFAIERFTALGSLFADLSDSLRPSLSPSSFFLLQAYIVADIFHRTVFDTRLNSRVPLLNTGDLNARKDTVAAPLEMAAS